MDSELIAKCLSDHVCIRKNFALVISRWKRISMPHRPLIHLSHFKLRLLWLHGIPSRGVLTPTRSAHDALPGRFVTLWKVMPVCFCSKWLLNLCQGRCQLGSGNLSFLGTPWLSSSACLQRDMLHLWADTKNVSWKMPSFGWCAADARVNWA